MRSARCGERGEAESWGWLQEAGLCGGPEGAAVGSVLSGRIFICTWTWRDGAGLTGISRGGSPVRLRGDLGSVWLAQCSQQCL